MTDYHIPKIPEEGRHYHPTREREAECGLIPIQFLRDQLGEIVADKTDQEMENLRERYYRLAYSVFYHWIDTLNKKRKIDSTDE